VSKPRLDLEALRCGRHPIVVAPLDAIDRLIEKFTCGVVSRRQFVSGSSATIVAGAVAPALFSQRADTFELSGDRRRLAFLVRGREQWVIEPSQFDGSPSLYFLEKKEKLEVRLTNAVYPGTSVAADFAVAIQWSQGRWQASFKWLFTQAQYTVDFIPWLLGQQAGEVSCILNDEVLRTHGPNRIRLSGQSCVSFLPTWTVIAAGQGIASVESRKRRLLADGLSISLAGIAESSTLDAKWGRRSIIATRRGNNKWSVTLPAADAPWSVEASDTTFDSAFIEVGSTVEADNPQVLVLQAAAGKNISFVPDKTLVGIDEKSVILPLALPRFAILSTDDGEFSSLTGTFADVSVQAFGDGFGMSMKSSAGARQFQLTTRDTQVDSIDATVQINDLTVNFSPEVHAQFTNFVAPAVSLCWTDAQAEGGCRLQLTDTHELLVPIADDAQLCVTRPADLLHLVFRFSGMKLRVKFGRGKLIAPSPDSNDSRTPARLYVDFPPQHIAEHAFRDPPDPEGDLPCRRPVLSRLSGPSTLAFTVLPGTEIPFTLAGLLDWTKLEPHLDPRAAPPGTKALLISKDADMVDPRPLGYTAIEAPYRMLLSPTVGMGWSHTIDVDNSRGNRIELWHSSLRVISQRRRYKTDVDGDLAKADSMLRTVRALWTPDFLPIGVPWWLQYPKYPPRLSAERGDEKEPFRFSPERRHRNQIVHLSSHYGMPELASRGDSSQKIYIPGAIQARHFSLSALGATIQLSADWEPPTICLGPAYKEESETNRDRFTLNVESWVQRSVLGRDSFVRVVEKGYLLPFGHRAAHIFVTDRVVVKRNGELIAYLRAREFVAVRRREKNYPAFGQRDSARDLPWQRVDITTVVTPALDATTASTGADVGRSGWVFFPEIGHMPFMFQFTAIDKDGNAWKSEMPMLFIPNDVARVDPELARESYNQEKWSGFRISDMRGQRVAFAPPSIPGNTAFPTRRFSYLVSAPVDGVDGGRLYELDQPAMYPATDSASVRIPAVDQLTGKSSDIEVRYHGAYVEKGFNDVDNRGEVYLAFTKGLALAFAGPDAGNNADKSGAVVTPNAQLIGLSRRIGPVGGTLPESHKGPRTLASLYTADRNAAIDAMGRVRQGQFDPSDFFGGLKGAKILGAVNLWDIIRPIASGLVDNLGEAPTMLREAAYETQEKTVSAATQLIALIDGLQNLGSPLRELTQVRFGSSLTSLRVTATKVRDASAAVEVAQLLPGLARDLTRFLDDVRNVVQNPGDLAADAAGALINSGLALLPTVDQTLTSLTQLLAPLLDGLIQFVEVDADVDFYKRKVSEFAPYEAELKRVRSELDSIFKDPARALEALVQTELNAMDLMYPVAVQIARFGTILDESPPTTLAGLARELWNLTKPSASAPILELRQTVDNLVLKVIGQYTEGSEQYRNVRQRIVTGNEALQATFKSLAELASRVVFASSPPTEEVVKLVLGKEFHESVDLHRELIAGMRELNRALDDLPSVVLTADDARARLKSIMREKGHELTMIGAWIADGNAFLTRYRKALPTTLRPELDQLADETVSAIQILSSAGTQLDLWFETATRLVERWPRVADPARTLAFVFLGVAGDAANRLSRLSGSHLTLLNKAEILVAATNVINVTIVEVLASNDNGKLIPPAIKQLLQEATGPLQMAFKKLSEAAMQPTVFSVFEAERAVLTHLSNAWQSIVQQIGAALGNVAQLVLGELSQQLEEILAVVGVPTSMNLRYSWRPQVKNFPQSNPIFQVDIGNPSVLSIDVSVKTRVLPSGTEAIGSSEYNLDGTLSNFAINLFAPASFLTLKFSKLHFLSKNGSKPTVSATLTGVVLGEELDFIQQLQTLLSPSSGQFVELYERGIRAGYRFAVPTTPVGSFLLSNLRFAVAVELPFTGEPARARFSVSEPAHPFLLRQGIYAGGGFLTMAVGLDGVEEITGALEFGIYAEISIGIASGEGYVLAGIYFSFRKDQAKVCGFVHAGGYLDVAGLISVSLHVDVRACYNSCNGNVEGTATITISIDFGLFEISVDVVATYSFAGSTGRSAVGLVSGSTARGEHRLLASKQRDRDFSESHEVDCGLADRREFARYRRHFAW
jgi:hypothetical protein